MVVTLIFALMIVGALPRMGKTFLLRLLTLAAALDTSAELHVYDLKGGADLLPLEPVAHRFRIGDEPDDLNYLKADLRAVHADMSRRYKTLRSLPRDVCPEGKVTRELADRRSLGLWPVVMVIDECQLAFDDDPETVALVTDLGKRGPAAGIIVLLATQRVDAKSLPTAISSNAVLRLCFKVAGQVENDMVLGTSMYKAGVRATTFARTDRGVGYLAGEGDDPVIVRAAYLDGPTAEGVAARARAARLTAGLLTGHAAGVDPDPDDSTTASWTTWRQCGRRGGQGLVGRPRRTSGRHLSRPLRGVDRGTGHLRCPPLRPEVDPDQAQRRRQGAEPPRPRPHRPRTRPRRPRRG